MSKAPSERELLRVERELKQASPGDQRAVGGGIYMRLDRSERRRFVLRALGLPFCCRARPDSVASGWRGGVSRIHLFSPGAAWVCG